MDIKRLHSSNRGQKLFNDDVVAIVLKYTRLDNCSKAVSWYCSPHSRSSCHVLISRAGQATQLVSPEWVAWHAPRGSEWNGYSHMNLRSVGISLDNLGPLIRGADGIAKPIGSGLRIPNPEVFQGEHKLGKASFRDWHAYPDEQLAELDRVLAWLVPQFPKLQAIVGADDLAPLTELAPGPALPARFLDVRNYQ